MHRRNRWTMAMAAGALVGLAVSTAVPAQADVNSGAPKAGVDAPAPIAFLLQGTCRTPDTYHSIVANNKTVLAAVEPGTECDISNGRIQLFNGKLLLHSKRPLEVVAGESTIYMRAGAAVLLERTDRSLSIISLQDTHRSSIAVLRHNRIAKLELGNQLIFTDARPTVSDVFNSPGVGRRHVISRKVPGFGWVSTASLNLAETITHEPLLVSVCKAPGSADEETLAAQLAKTAVIMQMVVHDKAPFIKRTST